MSELVNIIDSLEHKVAKLLQKLEQIQQTNEQLKTDLKEAQSSHDQVQNMILDWKEKYDSLKLANSMLGSNTNKTEAKLKINTLIRELDHCIGQLAE